MAFIADLFNAKREAEYFKQRSKDLEEKITGLEAKLFAEIDGNRVREDELKTAFLESLKVQTFIEPRTPLGLASSKEETPDEEEPKVNEYLIQQRVREYYEQAAASGRFASEMEASTYKQELAEIIRSNPEEYL